MDRLKLKNFKVWQLLPLKVFLVEMPGLFLGHLLQFDLIFKTFQKGNLNELYELL